MYISTTYPQYPSSKYPDAVDDFYRFKDLQLSDLTLAQQYEGYMSAGNLSAASQLLESNPQLKPVIINADNLNLLGDAIKSLQTYFFENAKDNWLKVYSYKGIWSASGKYSFFDMLSYEIDNNEQLFIGIHTNIPVGTPPTDETYFHQLTLQGEQGVSGSGMAPRGYYSTSKQYYKDDCVSYNNILWYAKIDSVGQIPQVVSSYWEKLMELPQQIVISMDEPSVQNPNDLWFEKTSDGSVQINVRNADGSYSKLYPNTKAESVTFSDGSNLEDSLNEANSALIAHINDNIKHVAAAERNKWNATANSWVATNAVFESTEGHLNLTVPNFIFTEGCTVTFKAPANSRANSYIKINNGNWHDVLTLAQERDLAGMWSKGSLVSVSLSSQSVLGTYGTAFFKSGGASRKPPTSYAYLQGYTANNTFIVPDDGWYRIYCVGKSGDGGARNTNPSGQDSAPGAKGGSSGGLSCSTLYLKKSTSIAVTVNTSISSFGSYLSATAGAASGGAAGSGFNGNVDNRGGFVGGNGGSAGGGNGSVGANGGMSGGYGGRSDSPSQPPGGGGGGGARLPGSDICEYISAPYSSDYRAANGGNQSSAGADSKAYPYLSTGPSMILFGGGGGGGGSGYFSSGVGGKHSVGTPGVVIIERGVS